MAPRMVKEGVEEATRKTGKWIKCHTEEKLIISENVLKLQPANALK